GEHSGPVARTGALQADVLHGRLENRINSLDAQWAISRRSICWRLLEAIMSRLTGCDHRDGSQLRSFRPSQAWRSRHKLILGRVGLKQNENDRQSINILLHNASQVDVVAGLITRPRIVGPLSVVLIDKLMLLIESVNLCRNRRKFRAKGIMDPKDF